METNESDLVKNENKLKKGLVILAAIFVFLILGFFAGQALHHILY